MRQPPSVNVGSQIVLLDKRPKLVTSLFASGGRVHVFVIDKENLLHHVAIAGDQILVREILGPINTDAVEQLDAVEQPIGKIRVLAGDKQYVQDASDSQWRKIEGNRCGCFLPAGDHLYCAFVTKGDEIGAPHRTDTTAGIFFVLPIVYWSKVQVSKLVVAEESSIGWNIRAVLDPETSLDADRDFLAGIDKQGTLRFLYSTSRGGGVFVVAAGPGGVGGSYVSPASELRYAQVSQDFLQPRPIDNQETTSGKSSSSWEAITGISLSGTPSFMSVEQSKQRDQIIREALRPLNGHFEVNKTSGEIYGLMTVRSATLKKGEREFKFSKGFDQACVEVGIGHGGWDRNFSVVTAADLPDAGRQWYHLAIRSDLKGGLHALMRGYVFSPWRLAASHDAAVYYLMKHGTDWSAPLPLGTSNLGLGGAGLAVNEDGFVFATWVSKDGTVVGRLITPHLQALQ
jgi:hypothetical protein